MKTLTIAFALLAPAAALAAQPALPKQYADNLRAPKQQAVASATQFLVGAQKDFKSPDRPNGLRATWAFERDGAAAAPNAAGIVARALLAAGDPSSVAAAKAFAQARAAEIEADLPTFDPDIEALAVLAGAAKDDRLMRAAKTAFERRHGMASGREIVERLFWVRKGNPALVGYDSAATLRAAHAVGDTDKAQQIVRALAETEARWNVASEQGWDLTSRAAVLEALRQSGAAPGEALVAKLRKQVLASQGKDGAWGTRNTQATAYSVRALAACGDETARAAAERGAGFLRVTQLKSGGWATFNDLLPEPFVGETVYEVTAEVVLALTMSAR